MTVTDSVIANSAWVYMQAGGL